MKPPTPKVYRYTYDLETMLFTGITREQPFAKNSTAIKPHFEAGFKTVYDKELKNWKLLDQNEYFEMMARYNKQAEFETDIREYIFLSTKALGEDIHAFSDKFDINNADRFIKLENHARSHEKDIKNIERIVEHAKNQAVNYRVDLGNEILKTNESIGRLTNSVNNLNITLNYIKFELDLPLHRRLWRFFVQWLS